MPRFTGATAPGLEPTMQICIPVVDRRGRVRETSAEVVQNGAVAATASATFLEERSTGGSRRPGDAP